VDGDALVRFFDVFVDGLDLGGLGFKCLDEHIVPNVIQRDVSLEECVEFEHRETEITDEGSSPRSK